MIGASQTSIEPIAKPAKMIPISQPALDEEEKKGVLVVLESGMLAQGQRVAEFERAFAAFIGVKHAIATSSGTTALHVALLAHGIGPGDEVVTTPFTFIASVNSILYTGARPVFVDIDSSFNIDPSLLEAAITPRTKAIMPVHLYGLPVDLHAISDIVRRHNLMLIEDACQAHGATFEGKCVGSFGTGCFSFYATKNMTTGEGGMITTNDDKIADSVRLLINHGMRVRYHHDQLGYNFRMTDIAAAIGIEQLEKLARFNARRSETAAFYTQQFESIPGLITPSVPSHRTHAWHQYTMRVEKGFRLNRDELVDALHKANIGAGIYYPIPVHKQRALESLITADTHFTRAEQFAAEVVSIPVHPMVDDLQRAYIAHTVKVLGK
jgi:perosamine synthetase